MRGEVGGAAIIGVLSWSPTYMSANEASYDPGAFPALEAYDPDEPLLLLTPYTELMAGGGAVILRSALRPQDRRRVVWVSMRAPESSQVGGPAVGLFGSQERQPSLLEVLLNPGHAATKVLEVASRTRARALWAVMHGPIVPIVGHLAGRAGLPMHLSVHDDPAFGVALRSRRHLLLTPLIERAFARALAGARGIDVVCEGMARRYRNRYGVSAIMVHRCMPGPFSEGVPAERSSSDLSVGVLGNTYSYAQLQALARALETTGRQLGKKVRLVVIGHGHGARLAKQSGGGIQVQALGHLGEADAVAELARCFLLYLNYPFGIRDAVLRETSFPTKLTTYIQAARPLLVHAPDDTSLESLRSMRQYVHPWSSMDAWEGAQVIVRAWGEPRCSRAFPEEAEAIRARHFDASTNRTSLFSALNHLVQAN